MDENGFRSDCKDCQGCRFWVRVDLGRDESMGDCMNMASLKYERRVSAYSTCKVWEPQREVAEKEGKNHGRGNGPS
ncbi:MAG: hypothetical protein ABSF90_10460 [Syntrophobacteraceae bacterium]|jgi:hypothetical protein